MTTTTKRKTFPITNIGSVTLLMIFIVLCMITFAALSLSSAASDAKATEKSIRHTKKYYKATSLAEETVADIDSFLKESRNHTSGKAQYFQHIKNKYKNNAHIKIAESSKGLTLTFLTKMNEKQALKTTLRILDPADNERYTITSWQTIATTKWRGDNSLHLLQE
ncbi:MAG: hypothetical protein Q4F98_06365 [Lachnospiraceae bacterium]|nr:hypothetical protein [Lachnospiraceae bacterium]